MWCVRDSDGVAHGPWLMVFDDDTAASVGAYVDGERRGPFEMWYVSGEAAAKVEPLAGAGTMTVFGMDGAALGTLPTTDGTLAKTCPEGTVSVKDTSKKGHTQELCAREDKEGTRVRHGRFVTSYPDGKPESTAWFVEGQRHGPYELLYPSGRPWVSGEWRVGEPHGAWSTWKEDGTVWVGREGASIAPVPPE